MNSGLLGFPNILGLLRATSLKVLGKPGATAGAGLAGGTTSGAPTSGQFDVGEAVVAADGHLWICIAAGSPGTWADAGAAGTQVAVQHGGSAVGSRPAINLIDGSNVTLSVADNSGSNRVDVTMAASAGGGSASFSWVTKTANYSVTTGDTGVLVDTSGGAVTITLPTAVGATQQYAIKKKTTDTNKVTVATTSSQTIDRVASKTLALGDDVIYVASDGSNWSVLGAALGDVLQLDFAASSDLMNATSVSSSTWTDVCSNQTFTVDDASSLVEICVAGGLKGINATTALDFGARLNVDSAGTPTTKMIGSATAQSNQYAALLAGDNTVTLSGLAAGSHTVKVQAWGGAAWTGYCRASSVPNSDFLAIRVLERKR